MKKEWHKVEYYIELSEDEVPKDIYSNVDFLPPSKYKIDNFAVWKVDKEKLKSLKYKI